MAILYHVEIHNIHYCMPQQRKEVFLTFLLKKKSNKINLKK